MTWRAIEALLLATGSGDYDTMARALVTIGATSGEVDIPAFAADLEKLFASLQEIDTELIVQAGSGGVSASVAADDAAVNRFLLDLVRCGGAAAGGAAHQTRLRLAVEPLPRSCRRGSCTQALLAAWWCSTHRASHACETRHNHQRHNHRPALHLPRRVGESNGIRFPREFALLIKQLLYFDRYNRILAPQLRVFDDRRINLRQVDLDFDLS